MKRITLITLGLSIAACTASSPLSSSSTPATAADYEDTAQTIASATVTGDSSGLNFGDVIVFRDALDIARGRLPLGFVRDSDNHCHGSHMGVGHDFTVACKDAAGATQTACNAVTDSATVTVKLTGSLQTPSLSFSIDREASFTLTGLQSATATFNGDSSFSLDESLTSVFRQGVTSALMFDATAGYKAITVTTADRTITGGSASFEVKAHRTVTGTGGGSGSGMGSNHDVDKSFDVTAMLTFNGDGTATLVLDGTQTFKIDLKTGKITKVM
ncbi:MAG TPA: hypothetical protein VHT91_31790 [Kofleriaceae bacterium]|jgi:hypothetical protein|nr:hypothetical protein [Kofleriaceae bacterium]